MTEWIITCNTQLYDVVGAFDKLDTIDWKQSKNIEVGDIVYIYVGEPIGALTYKCKAIEVNQPKPLIDDLEFVLDDSNYGNYGRYMRLRLLDKYNDIKLGMNQLKLNGLKTIQGPSKVTKQLSDYIFSVTETGGNSFDPILRSNELHQKTRQEAITILQRAYNRPVTARELSDLMYEIGKPQANVNSELKSMLEQGIIERYVEKNIYTYAVKDNLEAPKYFYVFQNQSFKEECTGEYLWAPKKAKDGSDNHHWTRMKEVRKGDVIFHGYKQRIVAVSVAKSDAYSSERPGELSADNWIKEGWRVDSEYFCFPHSIKPKDYWEDIKQLQPGKYAPFDKNGAGNMGYLFSISQDLARYILDATAGKKSKPVEAKKSEQSEEEVLLSGDPKVVIDKFIMKFEKKLPTILPKENELEQLRQKFVSDYTMNKLMNMTKEEYVVGRGQKDSFCYRLENELQDLGNIHGATSAKFGLYYGKSGEDTEDRYRYTKKFGNSEDEALEEIKKQIVFLRLDGEKKDNEAIKKCKLSPMFRGKILSVFFPEDYLCIFTDEHLDFFIKKLGIASDKKDDILDKQRKLVEWKQSRLEMKDWNNHLFSLFLYDSFGRPLEEKNYNEIQEERDKTYPKDYVVKLGINIGTWEKMLVDEQIFRSEDIALMKKFYLADNHATTCYDLSVQDGVEPISYINQVVSLAKRISQYLKLSPIIEDNGKEVWWKILFWGRYRDDSKFEWKLRPKLAKAMAKVFKELNQNSEIEEKEDNKLIDELKTANIHKIDNFEYVGEPREKDAPIYVNGHKTYPRDRKRALNALAHANYECEIDEEHPTFIRKKSGEKYTEPHHLVPMAFSDEFEVSLDVEENIVSLCSNCHNQIHYGEGADSLLKKLYEDRKEDLEKVGINISLEELLRMYGYK